MIHKILPLNRLHRCWSPLCFYLFPSKPPSSPLQSSFSPSFLLCFSPCVGFLTLGDFVLLTDFLSNFSLQVFDFLLVISFSIGNSLPGQSVPNHQSRFFLLDSMEHICIDTDPSQTKYYSNPCIESEYHQPEPDNINNQPGPIKNNKNNKQPESIIIKNQFQNTIIKYTKVPEIIIPNTITF